MAKRTFQQKTQMRTDEQAGTIDGALSSTYNAWSGDQGDYGSNVAGIAATLTTSLTGTNNDLVFTAKSPTLSGNAISITYNDPGGVTATLGVVVTTDGQGSHIRVDLGRAASAITTTGTLLKGAVDGDPTASALVSVVNAGGNDGSGLVTAMAKTFLSGGVDATRQHESFQPRQVKPVWHQRRQQRSTEQDGTVDQTLKDAYTDVS